MIKDYRKQTIKELNALVLEKEEQLEKIAQDILKNKEKNVKKVGAIKKDIARVKTVISEKSREEAKNA